MWGGKQQKKKARLRSLCWRRPERHGPALGSEKREKPRESFGADPNRAAPHPKWGCSTGGCLPSSPRGSSGQGKRGEPHAGARGLLRPRVTARSRGKAAGPARGRFPMGGGGRTKARCSLFCLAASEHSSGFPPTPAPSERGRRGKKSGFYTGRAFFPGPRWQEAPRASPAHPRASPARPAHPGWAGAGGGDKRALWEGKNKTHTHKKNRGEGGERKQPGGSNSICVAWKSEGVFPHFALI